MRNQNRQLALNAYSIESEQSILGGLLLDNSAIDRIPGLLKKHFYRESHQIIFSAIESLASKNVPIDLVTVNDQLEKTGELEIAGGIGYLAEIANNTPSAANIHRYAEIVRERAQLRALLAANDVIAGLLAEVGASADEKASRAQEALADACDSGGEDRRPRLVAHFAMSALQAIDARMRGEQDAIATGFADLDAALNGGLRPGNLVFVAARPGMGKTALALQIARHIAESGRTALFCSQEMGGADLALRIKSDISGIPLERLISGKDITDGDFDRLAAAVHRLSTLTLYLDEQPALTLPGIAAKARQVRREAKGLGAIFIDYLQLMSGSGENRNAEIERISRGLKTLAKALGVPVVALSQLNRGVESRPNKKPLLSDLRDSGSIEQDADIVLMLYRDEIYNADSVDIGTAEVLVRKQRQGRVCDVRLAWRGEIVAFRDLDWTSWQARRTEAAEMRAMKQRSQKRRGFGGNRYEEV
jgi:replicative DNA helicase